MLKQYVSTQSAGFSHHQQLRVKLNALDMPVAGRNTCPFRPSFGQPQIPRSQARGGDPRDRIDGGLFGADMVPAAVEPEGFAA